MRIEFTNRFRRQYARLAAPGRRAVDHAIEKLSQGLGATKALSSASKLFELRVNSDLRVTWEYVDRVIRLRGVARHGPALRRP